ncbi:MAG: polysaccharide biosynthesis/export family protein [Bacteroidota bacterium]
MNAKQNKKIILLSIIYIFIFSSCKTHKDVAYFKNIPDSIRTIPMVIQGSEFVDPLIQPNDILDVSVQTIDASTNAAIVGTINPNANGDSKESTSGFLVDSHGFIELPLVGRIKVGGKTITQARDDIHELASLYYKSPVVNVRFANFNITVLGDVMRSGTFTIPSEKASILDAIGLAGDLSISAKRGNILLIREEQGKKEFIRFSLNSTDIFSSPYFYLRQRDIIYVEPNRAKTNVATTDGSKDRYITYVVSIVSVLILLSTKFNIKF